MKHNKLVRDKIPELLKSKWIEFSLDKVEGVEYFKSLKTKLYEEIKEFEETENEEELADIVEVLEAIFDYKGFTAEDINKIKAKKKQERWGFEKWIILIETKE